MLNAPVKVKIEIAFCYFMTLSLSLYIVLLFNFATLGIYVHHLCKETRTCIYFFEDIRALEFQTHSLVVFSDMKQNKFDTIVDLHGDLLTQIGTFASMIIFWFLCIKLQHCLNLFFREQWFT